MKLPFLGLLAVVSFFIPVISGYVNRKALVQTSFIFYLYSLIAALEVTLEFILSLFTLNNFALSYFYRIIEVSIICQSFYLYFLPKRKRKIYTILPLVFVSIVCYDILIYKNIFEFKPFLAVVERSVLIIASIVAIYDLTITDVNDVILNSFFWFASGTILYCISTIVIFGFSDELLKLGTDFFIFVWQINWVMAIAVNIIYSRGFWCRL